MVSGPPGYPKLTMAQQSLLDETAARLVPPRPGPGQAPHPPEAQLVRHFRVTQRRGEPVESELAPVVIATIHPSSILRADDRDAELAKFVSDLETVAAHL